MCRQRFANGEISWAFDQMIRDYPDSPSKVWQRRTGLEEPPEVRAEEEKYQARMRTFGIGFSQVFERRGRPQKNFNPREQSAR